MDKELLKLNDQAFLNAILAYGVYTKQEWTLDKERTDMQTTLKKANSSVLDLDLKTAYQIYIAQFNRDTFEPVTLDLAKEGKYTSEEYGYSTEFKSSPGNYRALDNLASAGFYRSKNEDGTYTLHLSFRGTDTAARSFKDFVTKSYLDMSAYYDTFKPLEEAIMHYARNTANKVSHIHVSGHSLGGSMVQEFFKNIQHQKDDPEMKGFTYGAPGATQHKLYSLLPAIYHTVKHQKFLAIGKAMLNLFYPSDVFDGRITQYTHSEDLIPRLSAAAYGKSGNHIILKDSAHDDKRNHYILTGKNQEKCQIVERGKFKEMISSMYQKHMTSLKKAFTFQSHDMLRYVFNLNNLTKIQSQKYRMTKENLSPHYDKLFTYKQRFNNAVYMGNFDIMTQKIIENKVTIKMLKNSKIVTDAIDKIRAQVISQQISKDVYGQTLDAPFIKPNIFC